jgi:hypothetical protein
MSCHCGLEVGRGTHCEMCGGEYANEFYEEDVRNNDDR